MSGSSRQHRPIKINGLKNVLYKSLSYFRTKYNPEWMCVRTYAGLRMRIKYACLCMPYACICTHICMPRCVRVCVCVCWNTKWQAQ